MKSQNPVEEIPVEEIPVEEIPIIPIKIEIEYIESDEAFKAFTTKTTFEE